MDSHEFSIDIQSMEIPKSKKWRKEIIISIIAVLLIIALIITLIVVNSSSNEENEKYFGMINCHYKIKSESIETQIISESYKESPNFDIYIEGQKIAYSKKYKFEKAKTYNIQYKLKGDINID